MAFDWIKKKTSPLAGRAVGTNGAASGGGGPTRTVSLDQSLEGKLIVKRRHPDWLENQVRWRWLMDSHEGGERYRNAVYGPDRRGLPCRNLFRHKREYPDPQQWPNYDSGYAGTLGGLATGSMASGPGYGPYPGMLGADAAATAMDDDYELRRARTPIPEFVAEAVECHLAKIYDDEVHRDVPADLEAWMLDVDGCGTNIDDFMEQTIAPLLLVLGCIDVVLDHPQAPPGIKITTRLDEIEWGLDKVVASYILPTNMVWWRTDAAGRYIECLVREYVDAAERMDYDKRGNAIDPEDTGGAGEKWRNDSVRWRLWRRNESVVYNYDGSEELDRVAHTFGRVPIVRLIDLKKHRTRAVGKSRYEAIAEYQREYYNRDSELILSDTLQAHPFLSGAEDFCKADNTLSVGPGYVLPMKKNPENGAYEGFEYVSPPKDPAESLRKNKDDLIALKDRRACLSKPAGAQSPGTVGQSGLSKVVDQHTGHKLLTSIAKSLCKAEKTLAEYAAIVLRAKEDGSYRITPEEVEAIKIRYPAKFQLLDAASLIDGTTKLQLILAACGKAPETEQVLIQEIVHGLIVGLGDEEYEVIDDEIELLLDCMNQLAEKTHEMKEAGVDAQSDALAGVGSAEGAAGQDPTGVSAGTMVSGVTPSAL